LELRRDASGRFGRRQAEREDAARPVAFLLAAGRAHLPTPAPPAKTIEGEPVHNSKDMDANDKP